MAPETVPPLACTQEPSKPMRLRTRYTLQEPPMAITVRIPTVLRNLTGEKAKVSIEADTIDSMIASLESTFPGVKERLCDESGKLRRFVNVFVGDEDIRFLDGQDTALNDNDEVDIVPAIAGGC